MGVSWAHSPSSPVPAPRIFIFHFAFPPQLHRVGGGVGRGQEKKHLVKCPCVAASVSEGDGCRHSESQLCCAWQRGMGWTPRAALATEEEK